MLIDTFTATEIVWRVPPVVATPADDDSSTKLIEQKARAEVWSAFRLSVSAVLEAHPQHGEALRVFMRDFYQRCTGRDPDSPGLLPEDDSLWWSPPPSA